MLHPPHATLLASNKVSWNGISLQHCCQPPREIPAHCHLQHVIAIHHFKQPIKLERVFDGHHQTEHLIDGDIVVVPANVFHYFQGLVRPNQQLDKYLQTERIVNNHVVPQTTSHHSCQNREDEFTLLYLEPARIADIAYESINPDSVELLPHFAKSDPLIYQIGLALKAELESEEADSHLYAHSATTMLAAHLLRHYCVRKYTVGNYPGGLPKSKLRQVTDYINDNLDQDLRLDDLGAMAQMSSYHFTRLFKQSRGLTPRQYVIRCRIEAARRLLARWELSITQISQRLGFASHSQFTTFFRKHTGTTPTTYRQGL
jgi:AraC family transcriptional regulator